MIRFRVMSSAWRLVIFKCSATSSAVTNGSGVMLFILRLSALRVRFHLARTRHKPHLVATRFLNSHWETPNTSRLHDVQNDRLTLVEGAKGYKKSLPEIGGECAPNRTRECRIVEPDRVRVFANAETAKAYNLACHGLQSGAAVCGNVGALSTETPDTHSEAFRLLAAASEQDLAAANRRFDLVKRRLAGEELAHFVPARTMRLWVGRYRVG